MAAVPDTTLHPPRAAWLARLAVGALIDEAELTPKPALVDRRGSGAHVDLDLSLMRRSAWALEAGFAAMAEAARHQQPDQALRERLGALGRAAECAMFAVTQGSNAHRGAIWVLGLLSAAAAACPGQTPAALAAWAARLACHVDRDAPAPASHGAAARARYGVGGARGEAVAGFPHVVDVGLPALRAARQRGVNETCARLDALMAIVARLDDTCLLHRGGREALRTAQRGAQAVLAAGGSGCAEGWQALLALDAALLARNASPGGAADLLAATLFMDRLHGEGALSPSPALE